jgi:hypothetical protein
MDLELQKFPEVAIVSVFPFPINEDKPGLIPRYYHIPAAKDGDIEVYPVNPGIMIIDLVDRPDKIRIDISPAQIAMSLIRDFTSSQLEFTSDASPGLFAVSGQGLTKEKIKKEYPNEIQKIREKQNNWFRRLVFLADDDWAKYKQHRLISSIQRIAAKQLKLEREWIIEVTPPKSCPACGSTLPNANVAVCFKCGAIINESLAKSFKFAPVGKV